MPTPIRPTPVESFLRQATGLRVSAAAAELLVDTFTLTLAQLAEVAKERAVRDRRVTLLERDIVAAIETQPPLAETARNAQDQQQR